MIRSLFINKEALEKGAIRPQAPDQSVKKLGVIGAGMMGAGIAYVSANAGIEVVLIDATQEAADRGKRPFRRTCSTRASSAARSRPRRRPKCWPASPPPPIMRPLRAAI